MIQFNLEFVLEKPELPLELDRLLVSFLKASLERASPKMFEQLYDKRRSVVKPYTFSYYLPGAKFKDEKIYLRQNKFSMFFSNADMEQTIYFFNGFKKILHQRYPMNGNSMELVRIKNVRRKEIKDPEIIVKMQSSLIARRHDVEENRDTYYVYDHPEFSQVVKENVQTLIKRLGVDVSVEGFEIVPIKGKKIVATIFGRKVDANIGIYKLSGSPELLTCLYRTGMGGRRSEGHGMWEIVY